MAIAATYRNDSRGCSGLESAIGEARADYQHATTLDPNGAAPRVAMAEMFLFLEDGSNAELYAEQALAADPQNARAHYVLGAVAQLRGNHRDAGDHFVASGRRTPATREPFMLSLIHI